MIFISNLLIGLGTVLDMLLNFFLFLIIGRAIISWVNPDPMNPIVRFLVASTDPLIRPVRRWIPPLAGTVDISPLIVLGFIYLIKLAVAQSLIEYAVRLKQSAGLLILNLV